VPLETPVAKIASSRHQQLRIPSRRSRVHGDRLLRAESVQVVRSAVAFAIYFVAGRA